MVVMGREFLQVWVGEEFQNPAVIKNMSVILAILTVGHCLRLAQHSNFIVLVGKGEHRVFGLFALVMALLCVTASVVSVKVFNLGLIAVAWSNCVPVALISGIALPIYFNRKMNISVRDSISEIWWPALLGGMPAVIMISGWKYFYPPANWLSIALVILSAMLLTCLSAWCLSFTHLERTRFVKVLVPRLRRTWQMS